MQVIEALERMKKDRLEKAKGKKCLDCKEFYSFGNVGVCCLIEIPKNLEEDACQWFTEKDGKLR